MNTPDFTLIGAEESAQIALRLPSHQLAEVVTHFSPEQLQATLVCLVPEFDSDWQAKVRAFLTSLIQRHQLEAAGRVLTPEQMITLLDLCVDDSVGLKEKLQFILVGMPQTIFEATLHLASPLQLRVFKELGSTESIQHHLTLLIHELARLSEDYAIDMDDLERQIDLYDVTQVRQGDIDGFVHHIEDTLTFFHQGLYTIDIALSLAWNTTREDLIDRLTILKENWLRYLQFAIGRPGDGVHPATALYAKLEAKLNTIFGSPGSPEALTDDDPAIEALAALALWVLQDYWEVGLIPGIESVEQLDLAPGSRTEKERALFREKLARITQDNLSAIGLSTVGDLKRAHIYSRNMLIRYVQKHHSKLSAIPLGST